MRDPGGQSRDPSSSDRRAFLRGLGSSALLTWLNVDLAVGSVGSKSDDSPASTAGGILRLRLRAHRLDEMARFYAETLGLATRRVRGGLEVRAGGTDVLFEPAALGAQPVYHLAWAIPRNKLTAGKAWLAQRTPLLVHPDGRDEFHFRGPNRSAVYFADPAGNVLELIARHNLDDDRDGPFGVDDLLYVNHAGLVVDDMSAAIRELSSSLGLALRREPTPQFAQLGDEHRHLVLVTRDRLWLPEGKAPAGVHDTEIILHGTPAARMDLAGYPYRIATEPTTA